MHSVLYPREPRLLMPLQDCIAQRRKFLPPCCSPANKATGLSYGRIISRRCSGSFSNCIQALCSHLQWQDTKLHARGGCCPAAVAGYQTATCNGRIPNCPLQWQDTKLPLAVTGYQTACTRRLLPCCSSRIPNCYLQWKDTKLPLAVTGYQTACTRRLLPFCISRIQNCMRAWLPCCSVRLSNCFND
jgi:hypothetical protein